MSLGFPAAVVASPFGVVAAAVAEDDAVVAVMSSSALPTCRTKRGFVPKGNGAIGRWYFSVIDRDEDGKNDRLRCLRGGTPMPSCSICNKIRGWGCNCLKLCRRLAAGDGRCAAAATAAAAAEEKEQGDGC